MDTNIKLIEKPRNQLKLKLAEKKNNITFQLFV